MQTAFSHNNLLSGFSLLWGQQKDMAQLPSNLQFWWERLLLLCNDVGAFSRLLSKEHSLPAGPQVPKPSKWTLQAASSQNPTEYPECPGT